MTEGILLLADLWRRSEDIDDYIILSSKMSHYLIWIVAIGGWSIILLPVQILPLLIPIAHCFWRRKIIYSIYPPISAFIINTVLVSLLVAFNHGVDQFIEVIGVGGLIGFLSLMTIHGVLLWLPWRYGGLKV